MGEKTIRESHTIREDRTIREDQTIRETAGTQKDQGTTGETFRDYKIVRQLTTHGGEADAYIIEKEGQEYFLKLYRYGIQPKEEVLRKTYELSQSIPEHIVRIYEYGFDSSWQRWYEVQEYVRLGNLKDYVLNRGLVGVVVFAKELVKELSSAIHSLHERGIIHRDLKPQNILVRRERPFDIVLTDFGISSIVDSDVSKIMTTTKGTYAYSAPESFSGYFGKEVDWWAVGMIILEVMTGKNPLSGLSPQVIMHHLSTKAVPIAEDIPEDFKVLIKGLLTRDPKKRWGYAQIKSWLEGKRDIPVYYEEGTKEYSLKEWLDAGFTEQGAKKWMEVVDDPQLAIKLKNEVGLTPEEAKKWISVGIINPYVISTWISAGFRNPKEVKIYEDLGLGPRQADTLRKLGYGATLIIYSITKCGLDYDKLVEIGKWANEKGVELALAVEYVKELGYYEGVFEEIVIFRNELISPSDAKLWKDSGFSLNEAKEWKNAGFSPKEAKEWKDAGFSPNEAKEWINTGFFLIEAEEWRDSGFSLNEAKEWKNAGLSPKEAKEWKDAGFSPREAKKWKNAGFSLNEAKNLKNAGFSLSKAKELIGAWFSSDEAKEWRDAGFSLIEAKEWRDAGLSPIDAKKWKDTGFSAKEAKNLKNAGFSLSKAKELIGAWFSSDEAKEWRDAGFSLIEAKEWKDAGFSPKDAKEWKNTGFSLNEAKNLKNAGFSSDEAKEWRDAGFSLIEAKEWKDAGFSPKEAKEWRKGGFNSKEAAILGYILDSKYIGLVQVSWYISGFIGLLFSILLVHKIVSSSLSLTTQKGLFHLLLIAAGFVFLIILILTIIPAGLYRIHRIYTFKLAENIRNEGQPPSRINDNYILLLFIPPLIALLMTFILANLVLPEIVIEKLIIVVEKLIHIVINIVKLAIYISFLIIIVIIVIVAITEIAGKK